MKEYRSGVVAALFPVFAVSFVSHIAPYIYIPSLPAIAATFNIGLSETGGLMSVYYLALSVTLLLVGVDVGLPVQQPGCGGGAGRFMITLCCCGHTFIKIN